jgi:hypothetical protein
LIWCGVGCGADDVVAAVGLGLSDLFPPRPDGEHYAKPKAPAIPWRDVLSALGLDLIACSLAFNDLAAGKPFSPEDATYIAQRADDLAAIIREVHHAR